MNVPKEGGTFTISIQTDIEVSLRDEDLSNSFYESEPISCNYSLEENKIKIQVNSATGAVISHKQIGVFDKKGYCLAVVTIKQEGQSGVPTIGDNGMFKAFMLFAKAHWESHIIWLDYNLNLPLQPNDKALQSQWNGFYTCITRINTLIEESETAAEGLPPYAPLQVLRAFYYYKLVNFWGNVPYVIETNIDNYQIKQSTAKEVLEALVSELVSAIERLEEKKNDTSSYTEGSISFSKDVARMALAHIYMYQNNYKDAQTLLQAIVDNNYYSLDDNLIFALDSSKPIYTYTDVILSLAECELYANNEAKAMEYIKQVADEKNITITETEAKAALKEVYKATLANYGGYFAFLKRNGLAMSELGLESEHYLLFPIPQSEIEMNPNIVQNPGY